MRSADERAADLERAKSSNDAALPIDTPARAELESRAAAPGMATHALDLSGPIGPTHAPPLKNPPFVPLSLADSKQRKMMPVVSGVLDYFPDAIAAVSYISYLGNQKHNPGQDLHWARGKSDDHIDCLGRHLLRRDCTDQDDIMEFAEMVWRAMAALQLHIEHKFKLPPSPGSK
jgi:hypothetical protein